MNFIRLTFALASLVIAAQVHADPAPSKVAVSFNRIYVPDGYDDNDSVQIIGEGAYANSCYHNAETRVKVNHFDKTIFLEPMAYKYSGYCLQVIIPFHRTVDLGILQSGTYQIYQVTDGRRLGQITINPSKASSPDDRLYAPVSQSYFQGASGNKVVLAGDMPVSCMILKEIKKQVQNDVIVLQPVVDIDSSQPCVQGSYHFEVATSIGSVKNGKYFLQVRAMSGKSVSSLVDIR